jgi:hypothetical protein
LKIAINRIATLSFLSIIITLLIYFILKNATFLVGDDSSFLTTTAIGKYYPASTFVGWNGRFPPLMHWIFNVLLLFPGGKSALAHFLVIAVGFFIFTLLQYLFFRKLIYSESELPVYNDWLIIFCTVFISVRVYPVFLDLYMAENIAVVCISLFLIFYFKFWQTSKVHYGILALIPVIFVTYVKEPIFGSFLVLSMTVLIFSGNKLSKTYKIFHWSLVLNFLVFAVLYYLFVLRHSFSMYGEISQLTGTELIYKVFRNHKVLFLAFLLTFYRLYCVIVKKDRQNLIYDALLFAGVSYSVAMLILKMSFAKYYLPALVFSFPAIIFWAVKTINIRWVSLIMLISAMYCTNLIINDIKENQQARSTTLPILNSISELISEGYSLYWYQPELNIDFYDIREDKKSYLEIYLRYLIKERSEVKTIKISTFKDLPLNENCLVLNPNENESNSHAKKEFEDFITQNKFKLFQIIQGVKIYKTQYLSLKSSDIQFNL